MVIKHREMEQTHAIRRRQGSEEEQVPEIGQFQPAGRVMQTQHRSVAYHWVETDQCFQARPSPLLPGTSLHAASWYECRQSTPAPHDALKRANPVSTTYLQVPVEKTP